MEKPLWTPSQDRVDRANLSRFMRFVREEVGNADLNSYGPLYRFSIEQPAQFWTLLWDFVGLRASGDRGTALVAGDSLADARWFPDVSLNFAQNLLRFDDERLAIRCHGADSDIEAVTYAQLQRRVAALSSAMRAAGLSHGDRVAAMLPNVPDALVAMLATAAIGAIWFAMPPGLDAVGLAERVSPLQPALLFLGSDDDGARMAASLRKRLPSLREIVRVPGLATATVADDAHARALASFVAGHEEAAPDYTATAFDHPLYLTRKPLAEGEAEFLVHGAGGTLLQHLKELVLHLDLRREDKLFFHAGIDTMAWYWLASSLAVGATLVLHAGAELPAEGAALWDLVDEYGITTLGVHSQWLEAAARAGIRPQESHRLLALKTLLTAGAPLAPECFDYVYEAIKDRVLLEPISTGGDTLACFALGAPLLPVWRGEIPCRALGMKVETLDESDQPITGEAGDLACTAPFPSMPTGFWNDPDRQRYRAAYFHRHAHAWCRGDRAVITAHDGVVVLPPEA